MIMWVQRGKMWGRKDERDWWLLRLRGKVIEIYERGEWVPRILLEDPIEFGGYLEAVIAEGKAFKIERLPSEAAISQWVLDSVVEAVDGCLVEPDGVCPHGTPSWLIVLGMI